MILRELEEKDLPFLNQLVSNSFGYKPPHSFFDDFPVWNQGMVTRLGFFDGPVLAAHVGFRFSELKIPAEKSTTIALIGGVATHQNYRRQGLSTQLLNEASRRIDIIGAEWSFLWGSEHEFYSKIGFALHGKQYRISVVDLLKNKTPASIPVQKGLTEEIFQSVMTSPHGLKISEQDRSWFFSHKTVKWFYTKAPFAYIAFERGMDLPHLIHEMGGDKKGLESLMAHILKQDPEAQVLCSRAQAEQFSKIENFLEESMCLARPKSSLLKWNPSFWVQGLGAC